RVDNHRRREAMNKSFWTSCLSRVLLAACLLAPAVAWADPVQEFRARINAATAEHASAAEPVARIQDIVIPGLYGDIPLRLYDASAAQPAPAILYIHGAGWIGGSIASHDNIARKLANELSAMVISVDYRLAPEFPYPTALEETFVVLKWMASHAGVVGLDADRIAVAGDSAGGNLAAALALVTRDRKGPQLSAQVLINPALELDAYEEKAPCIGTAADQAEFVDMMKFFTGLYVSPDYPYALTYVSPLKTKDLNGLPPALVVTGGLDLLCPEGEAYVTRLKEAGVTAELLRADDAGPYGVPWAAAEPSLAPALNASNASLRQVWGN